MWFQMSSCASNAVGLWRPIAIIDFKVYILAKPYLRCLCKLLCSYRKRQSVQQTTSRPFFTSLNSPPHATFCVVFWKTETDHNPLLWIFILHINFNIFRRILLNVNNGCFFPDSFLIVPFLLFWRFGFCFLLDMICAVARWPLRIYRISCIKLMYI